MMLAPQTLEDFMPSRGPRGLVDYDPHAVIYGAEETQPRLYWVVRGRVLVTRQRTANKVLHVGTYGPSTLFGEFALAGLPVHEQAKALTAVTLQVWRPVEFSYLLASKPGMQAAFVRLLLTREQELLNRLAMSGGSVRARLGGALLRMAEALGEDDERGCRALSGFTHERLADLIMTSRECVTAELTELRRAGVIRYNRRVLLILDAARMRAVAEGAA